MTIFLQASLSVRLHFFGDNWIDKLHNFMDGIYFLTMVAMEIGKDNFLVTIATFVSREEKALSKP